MLNLPQSIKLIATDFDGIFTDGGIYFSATGADSFKKICYADIMGVALAVKSDIKIAIISGDKSGAIDHLRERFNLQDTHQRVKNKLAIFSSIMEKYGLGSHEVCYMGDDINDMEVLSVVKYPITVPNANYMVKQINEIQVTSKKGGEGAFREAVDSILYGYDKKNS